MVGQPDAVGGLVEGVAGRVHCRGVHRQDDGRLAARAHLGRGRRGGGRIVCRGVLSWSTVHDTSVSRLVVEVLPELRQRGIGSALSDHLERLSTELGRRTLQAQAVHSSATGGERVAAASGCGHLSTTDPGVRFIQRRGYRLEQLKRASFLDLPVDPHRLLALRRSAQDAAGDAYYVVKWTGRPPARRPGMPRRHRAGRRGPRPGPGPRRALVSHGWADLALIDDRDDCFAVGEVNQQGLFGRVAAVVHHGDAGTMTTAARAGAPQVVVSQASDQPYWAGRVADLGVGAAHDGPTPTTESRSAALRTALAPETRARATAVAGTIRTDGATVAARLLRDAVSRERPPASA